MKRILTAIALFAACLTPAVQADTAKAGQASPKLASVLPGAKVPATAGKVVLVDFWASWCGPCKKSFPCLNALQEKYASKGLVIVAVGVDEKAADYQNFASKMKAAFPLVHDATHACAAAFGPSTMPTSYLVDRKGVIRYVHTGFKGAKTEAEYTKEIEALLAESR